MTILKKRWRERWSSVSSSPTTASQRYTTSHRPRTNWQLKLSSFARSAPRLAQQNPSTRKDRGCQDHKSPYKLRHRARPKNHKGRSADTYTERLRLRGDRESSSEAGENPTSGSRQTRLPACFNKGRDHPRCSNFAFISSSTFHHNHMHESRLATLSIPVSKWAARMELFWVPGPGTRRRVRQQCGR